MTKIKFKKWRLYANLLLGLLWVFIALFDFLFSYEVMNASYGFIIAGIIYLGHFFYDLKHQYLKIENQTIQKNFIYGGWNKKIKFEDIISIEKLNLNYTLITESTRLKINTDLIEYESYKELKSILKSIDLPEDKKPALI